MPLINWVFAYLGIERGYMEHSRGRYNPYLVKTAGLFSILAGILSLAFVFYVLVVLGSYGFRIQMSSDTTALMAWINKHAFAYSILWLHQIVFSILMIPVPFAASQVFKQHQSSRSSALATLSYLQGMVGFILMLISGIIFFASSPIAARAFVHGAEAARLMYNLFEAMAMQMRLFAEILISMWFMGIGLHLVRKNSIDMFGWYSFVLFIFTVVVAMSKSYNIFNWEPFLAIILAFTYVWLGWLMRQKAH